ncbi:MAG TPA: hypothetical protein VGR07_01815 [Thermoanaerobaculia bacterium]|jgi:hypothetical protein|nr:hypothetical protein [Thermoanaerobaculia bacterium]
MKKKAPKMKLSRETLRNLDEGEAREVAGAFVTQTCSNTRATCYTCGADPGAVGAHPAVACA